MSFNDEKGKWIQGLWSQAQDVLKYSIPEAYEVLDDGTAERHGSYERVYLHRDERTPLDRFVVLAVTPTAVEEAPEPRCAVNVWIGAEHLGRFGRHRLLARDALGSSGVIAILSDVLWLAFKRAESMSVDSLEYARLQSGQQEGG